MESQSSTQVKVGIFLAIGIVIILASIFMLGADKAFFTDYIRIHARFESVQGLAQGSIVSLSGVTVGNVEEITFSADTNSLNVKMKIDEKFAPRIRQGSQVEIRTQGALGDKFVYIIPADPNGEMIKEGDILDVAKATDLIGVISERGGETSKIFDIIHDLHILTKTLTAENRMGRLMGNLETASSSLTVASKEAQKFVTQFNENNVAKKMNDSIQKLDSVMNKIDKGQGTLGALVNDPTIHNQLKAVLGGSTRNSNVKSLLRTSIEQEEKK